LVLDVPKARETYSLLKAKVLRGLSIGYDTVKSDVVGGVRRLKELKLFEISVVTLGANEFVCLRHFEARLARPGVSFPASFVPHKFPHKAEPI
jgi:hypothetical protein